MTCTNPSRINVPLFALWFVLAFAGLCLVPWHETPKHGVLPLATPYVNEQMWGPQTTDQLLAHTAVSIAIALAIDAARLASRRSKNKGVRNHF